MAQSRPIRWEEGETQIACDCCGLPAFFPSEMRRLSDGLFYCYRHVEFETGKTKLDDQRERAALAAGRKEQPVTIGKKPSWW